MHRNLTPSKLGITSQYILKILDFSKSRQDNVDYLSAQYVTLYSPPEISFDWARGLSGIIYDSKGNPITLPCVNCIYFIVCLCGKALHCFLVDIWSAACIIYEMITKEPLINERNCRLRCCLLRRFPQLEQMVNERCPPESVTTFINISQIL